MAIGEFCQRVKCSYIGPLFAGKGFRGLSQNGWFLGAPEDFGHFGPELFSALGYPRDFQIMQRIHASEPSQEISQEEKRMGPNYSQKRKLTF